MKELLYFYGAISKKEVFDQLCDLYKRGYTYTARKRFNFLAKHEQSEFISTLDPYDPAYTFFSTMGFAETV